jgi:hypothetical protein
MILSASDWNFRSKTANFRAAPVIWTNDLKRTDRQRAVRTALVGVRSNSPAMM